MSKLTDLRALLQTKFPAAMVERQDAEESRSLDISLLRGKLIEVVVQKGGGGSLLWRLTQVTSTPFALIDGADSMDPASFDASIRQRLLWIRCQKAQEAMRAADLLLRDGNLSTVLIDLRQLPMKDLLQLPSSIWHRLRMLAERAAVSVAVFSPSHLVSCAARRWILQPDLHLRDLDTSAADLIPRLNPRLQRGISVACLNSPAFSAI